GPDFNQAVEVGVRSAKKSTIYGTKESRGMAQGVNRIGQAAGLRGLLQLEGCDRACALQLYAKQVEIHLRNLIGHDQLVFAPRESGWGGARGKTAAVWRANEDRNARRRIRLESVAALVAKRPVRLSRAGLENSAEKPKQCPAA